MMSLPGPISFEAVLRDRLRRTHRAEATERGRVVWLPARFPCDINKRACDSIDIAHSPVGRKCHAPLFQRRVTAAEAAQRLPTPVANIRNLPGTVIVANRQGTIKPSQRFIESARFQGLVPRKKQELRHLFRSRGCTRLIKVLRNLGRESVQSRGVCLLHGFGHAQMSLLPAR